MEAFLLPSEDRCATLFRRCGVSTGAEDGEGIPEGDHSSSRTHLTSAGLSLSQLGVARKAQPPCYRPRLESGLHASVQCDKNFIKIECGN